MLVPVVNNLVTIHDQLVTLGFQKSTLPEWREVGRALNLLGLISLMNGPVQRLDTPRFLPGGAEYLPGLSLGTRAAPVEVSILARYLTAEALGELEPFILILIKP